MKKYFAGITIMIFAAAGIFPIAGYFGEILGLIEFGKDPMPAIVLSIPLQILLGIAMAFLFNYRQMFASIIVLGLFILFITSMFYYPSITEILTQGITDQFYWRHILQYFLPIFGIYSASVLIKFGIATKILNITNRKLGNSGNK
jgi:hypothetical protein